MICDCENWKKKMAFGVSGSSLVPPNVSNALMRLDMIHCPWCGDRLKPTPPIVTEITMPDGLIRVTWYNGKPPDIGAVLRRAALAVEGAAKYSLVLALLLTGCILESKAPDQEIPVTCTAPDSTLYQDSSGIYRSGDCTFDDPRPGARPKGRAGVTFKDGGE